MDKINEIKWIADHRGLAEAYIKLSVPSVSTILRDMVPDPEMDAWIAKDGIEKVNEILKQAAYRGTVMHKYIDTFLKDYFCVFKKVKDINTSLQAIQNISFEKDNIPENKIVEGWNLFYKWFNYGHIKSFNKFYSSELGIYSKRLFYRGILDVWYNHINYGATVTDFKTASSFVEKDSIKEKKHKLQIASYVLALEEMLNERVNPNSENHNLLTKINAGTICLMNTKSDLIQEIVLQDDELNEYKNEFKTLVEKWHIENNQSYLINN